MTVSETMTQHLSLKGAQSHNSLMSDAIRRLLQNGTAIFGGIVICFFIGVAFFAPLIAPYDPLAQNLPQRLDGPSAAHFFGQDEVGRDILSRVIYGTRTSLAVGLVSVSISLVMGTLLGLVAGYAGGWVEDAIMRVMDIVLAFPAILLAIAIVTVRGPGLFNTMIAIGIVGIPLYARLVRSSVLSLKKSDYVLAARSIGVGDTQILFRHIFPNSLSPLIVQATLSVALAIVQAAGLGFLGLGAQPPTPEWGAMLSGAYRYLITAPWLVFFVGAPIVLVTLAFNLLGDGLRDALDPRMPIVVTN